MARHPKRPLGSAYIAALDQFDELHGDRHFGDDPAIVGGFAKLRGRRIVAIAQDKGGDTKEKVHRNFGMPRPEGYRKVQRLVRARRASRPAGRDVRRYLGRRSGDRFGGTRAVRGDRAVDRGASPRRRFRSSRRSSAKAAAAARWRWRWPIT